MQPYEERLVDEQNELLVKIHALHEFMVTDGYDKLSKKTKILLLSQSKHMRDYSAVLGQRILDIHF